MYLTTRKKKKKRKEKEKEEKEKSLARGIHNIFCWFFLGLIQVYLSYNQSGWTKEDCRIPFAYSDPVGI